MSGSKLICSEINCPFANVNVGMGKSSGCTRYSTSYHCHLRVNHTLEANEYWIYAKDPSDELLAELKIENDEYIANDQTAQRHLRMERLMGERK